MTLDMRSTQTPPNAAEGPGSNAAANPEVTLPPDALIILPVRNVVLFPGVVFPIAIGRPTLDRGGAGGGAPPAAGRHPAAAQCRGGESGAGDLHAFGTLSNIVRYITAPDGSHHLVCQGEQRFRVTDFIEGLPFLAARVMRIPEPESSAVEVEGRFLNLREQALGGDPAAAAGAAELINAIRSMASPGCARRPRRPPTWTRRRRRSRRSWRRSTSRRAWTRSRASSPTASRC